MRRATCGYCFSYFFAVISIHALHEESDSRTVKPSMAIPSFQSTLSMRRATGASIWDGFEYYISIHALHEESDPTRSSLRQSRTISIHALHEESDRRSSICPIQSDISIHALHEESDSAAGHFCPLFETQASCLALSISNNTADTTNNMSKTSNWLSVSF